VNNLLLVKKVSATIIMPFVFVSNLTTALPFYDLRTFYDAKKVTEK